MKIFVTQETVTREQFEEDSNILAEVREAIETSLTNKARIDDQNLPGEFLFRLEYLVEDPDAEPDQDPYVDVQPDDPWQIIIAKGRLSCGG